MNAAVNSYRSFRQLLVCSTPDNAQILAQLNTIHDNVVDVPGTKVPLCQLGKTARCHPLNWAVADKLNYWTEKENWTAKDDHCRGHTLVNRWWLLPAASAPVLSIWLRSKHYDLTCCQCDWWVAPPCTCTQASGHKSNTHTALLNTIWTQLHACSIHTILICCNELTHGQLVLRVCPSPSRWKGGFYVTQC